MAKPFMKLAKRGGSLPVVKRVLELILGPPLPAKLPARVTTIIRQQQETSEIVISFTQIGAIIFFAVFYMISPKAFPDDVPFEPIPVTLAIYGLFTLWRTKLALQRALTPTVLTGSLVIDVTVLMITIWSFHLQYQTPPEMYLKAPTLMYVFIMIAMRALRFEPRYVIYTGLTAAVCWTVLVLYALIHGDQSMITRQFEIYATSYSVLIGAEVDKMISILAVTAILALVVQRARRVLYRAALEGQAAADFSLFFAPEVAGKIRSTDQDIRPGMAEAREAAILFIDLRGFTPLSQSLKPQEVMALLSDYQDMVLMIIRKHGGSIDKFMGDGILASFGAVQGSTTYAADGLAAMEELRGAAELWRRNRTEKRLPVSDIGAAMATGPVLFGAVGSRDRLEYTVIGETVNLAAKLEKHCKAEQSPAILPSTSLDLARQQGFNPAASWQIRKQRQVAGVGHAVDLAVHVDEAGTN